jgi:hypothetical protein
MVRAAKGSAATLVELITAHFPGFRDHTSKCIIFSSNDHMSCNDNV